MFMSCSCTTPTGYATTGNDCDDNNASVHPGGIEICNAGIDDDCNGLADDADPSVTGQNTYYADADGDGYGGGSPIFACVQPPFTSLTNDDCDDGNPSVNPGATEICNSTDDNCNGQIDEGLIFTTYYIDVDGDGNGSPLDPGFSSCINPGPGFATIHTDCNDLNNSIHPGAPEICNGVDDDCNGQIDEATAPAIQWQLALGFPYLNIATSIQQTADGGML